MGNQNQRKLLPPGYDPVLNGWEIKEKNEEYNVWRNPETGEEVDEYRRVFNDRRDYGFERDTFEFRHSSSTLVSSVYMKQQTQQDVCTTFYRANLFLEHITHRLSEIEHIPYPDILHIYHQAFRGFAELYDRVGYFEVEDSLICMNKQGVVKVWLNPDLSRAVPLPIVTDCIPSEANMIRKVINVIHANTDHYTLPENILDTMRRHNVTTFREADGVLEQIAARHRTLIPSQLDCVLELDLQPLRDGRRTIVTGSTLPGKTTTVTETITPAPHTLVSFGAPPMTTSLAVPVVAPTTNVVTSTVSPGLSISAPPFPAQSITRPSILQASRTVGTPLLTGLRSHSAGPVQLVSNTVSRTNLSPVLANKPASAIRYHTLQTQLAGRQTSVSRVQPGLATLGARPSVSKIATVIPSKSASAINFTSPVTGRVPLASPLPTIVERPGPQIRKISGPQKPLFQRNPSITFQAGKPGLLTNKFPTVKLQEKPSANTSSDGSFSKPATAAPSGIQIPTQLPPKPTSDAEIIRNAVSPVTVLQTKQTAYTDFTSDDFYTRYGIKRPQDLTATFKSKDNIQSTPIGNLTSYESKQASVSPAPAVVQPITHTNVYTENITTTAPMSVSLTDAVTNSIAVNANYGQTKYEALATGTSVLQGDSTLFDKGTISQSFVAEKEPEKQAESPKKYQILGGTTTINTTNSPPKIEFTYSSEHIPGGTYSRTILAGQTAYTSEVGLSKDIKSYQRTETYTKQTVGTGSSSANFSSTNWGGINTAGFGSYLPATSTTSYELTASNAYFQPSYTTSGISPPSSRVANRLVNLSPQRTSPTRNTSEEIRYSAYQNSSSIEYSTSQAYQSSGSRSLLTNQASNVPTVPTSSYQPQSMSPYKAPATGGSYQGTYSSSYQASSTQSYSIQMDTELLKDLQKLKKEGTLSPKKEEFNTGVSFGNNSGYIRDSLKNQAR